MTAVDLHFVDSNADRNPPIVFVHGFACALEDWAYQSEFFAPTNRVIACDLPGHGQTAAYPGHNSIAAMGADVAHLIINLDLSNAVLVGHSMGCRVVMQACLDIPERIDGLVFMDGSWIGQGDGEARREASLKRFREHGYEHIVQGLFEDMFVPSSDPTLKRQTIERACARPPEYAGELFADLQAWDCAILERAVKTIKVPTLAIQSTYLSTAHTREVMRSGDTTPWLDVLSATAARPTIKVVPEVGHMNMMEAPQVVNETMKEFIAGLAS